MQDLEAILAEQSRQLLYLAETLSYCAWTADANGIVDYVSDAFRKKVGAPPEEEAPLPEFDWLSYYHPDDRRSLHDAWIQVAKGREPASLEGRLWDARAQEYRRSAIEAAPLFNEDGTLSGWQGVTKDVHEQREAVLELARSEERLRLLTESSIDGIWDWDPVEEALWCSPGMEDILGKDPLPPYPNERWLAEVHPDDRERIRALEREIELGKRDRWEDRYRVLRPDGKTVWVRSLIMVMRDEDGQPKRYLGAMADITEVRQIEEQLHRAARLEAIGSLTGGIAHDFNNLLTIILGNVDELARNEDLDRGVRQLAREARSAAFRGAELISRLLVFAREQDLDPKPVDVASLIYEMESLVRRTLATSITLTVQPEPATPPALVDPVQLESAILNLCVNAMQAMPDGGSLRIESRQVRKGDPDFPLAPDLPSSEYVYIGVADDGPGMSQEVIDRAFEPFFTTKEASSGSGLGLSMVYGFVTQSGGHADIISRPKHGTRVRLFLPVAEGKAMRTMAATWRAPHALRGKETILLVEDDPSVRAHVARQLEALGYRIVSASNADEAIKVIESDEAIDLLFTDVMMPGMGGRQLASVIRAFRGNLPILFTSGFDESERALGSEVAGGAELLRKPYVRDELAAAIRRALERGREKTAPDPEPAKGILGRTLGRIRRSVSR